MIHRLFPVLASLLAGACATGPVPVAATFESRPMTRPPAGAGGEADGRGAARAIVPDPLVGMASWYGPRHHGKRTAGGDRFDMRALTAAHPSLPLGTRLRVTLPATGRSVLVTVNDRGPYAGGRILDLSWRAARDLGLLRRGVALVVAQPAAGETAPVTPASRRTPASRPDSTGGPLLAGGFGPQDGMGRR